MTHQDFKETLREGIYHEIGHVVATWLCFSYGDRLRSICLKMNPYGSYGLCAVWIEDIKFDYRTQLDAFTYSTLGGGVFQQMKNAQLSFNSGESRYSFVESVVDRINTDRAFQMYINRNVKPYFRGMEEDLGTLLGAYDELYDRGYIKQRLDIKNATKNCISLLFPFINRPEIDSLCDYCLNAFWEGGQDRMPLVEVDTETIKGFIGGLF